jgi:hypothetical protein
MNLLVVLAILFGLAVGLVLWQIRRRSVDRWIIAYVEESSKRCFPRRGEAVHVLLCIGDHFEPKWAGAPSNVAAARVDRWTRDFPKLFGAFADSDGRPPRHTFFYPIEEYEAEYLDGLADLCRAGFGEVEVHLHHDHDTPDGLRRKLVDFKNLLARRHGLLGRDRTTGALAYGFIHGNWALNNSRPDGRWCGVNDETSILRATGCYADFTMPSAPSPTQTRKINSIYYGSSSPDRPKGHDWGPHVGRQEPPANALMLIQGPLLVDWRRRKWGVLPRIENSCLQASQPPNMDRLELWLKARIQVPGRPDWFFVKLHTHGAIEANQTVLLGEAMVKFHQDLARRAAQDAQFHFHYVSAREMYNLARAAEAGWAGSVAEARNFQVIWDA